MTDQASLPEAVALTAGLDFWHTQSGPGSPSILLADGPHGVRKQLRSDGFSPKSEPATCFPTASALAATWDVQLVAKVGVALGEEARAQGVSVLLGPGVNIKRSALCGRNFEYFSEDPYLSSHLAAAWIDGLQSTGVGACVKHFAANNQEHRRYTVDARIDERTLREIYLASFEHAVVHARPASVMAAYNRLNGEHCTTSRELLTRILREEWGFDGAVVSDWGATADRIAAIAAGLDLDMPGFAGKYDGAVREAVHSGALPEAAVVRAAANVCALVARTAAARHPGADYDQAEHHTLAGRTAAAGTVLLRNDGTLPLPATGTIAVIGAFARSPRYQGAGSSGVNPLRLENLWDELGARTDPDRLRYGPGYPDSGAIDPDLIAEARTLAASTDLAVVYVGLPASYEVEGVDRTHLDLPPGHNALVAAVADVNPRTVVVLGNGAPVLLPWVDRVGAVVEAYLGGQAGGGALADVLLGRAEPGGRLAETFPRALADNPVHTDPNGPTTVEYREGVFVGYRHYDRAALDVAFPFGHGLSYTTFDWSTPSVESTSVRLTVTNTGTRAGSDVVQVYVHDVLSTVDRPDQELKAFAKVHLEPGASEVVTLPLDPRAFAFWDVDSHDWVVEPGAFEIRVGASSRDIRYRTRIELPGDVVTLRPRQLSDEGPKPANEPERPGHYTVQTPLGDLRHPVARLFLRTLIRAAKASFRSTPDSPMVLILEDLLTQTPARMLPMITEGRLSPRFARALVAIANGRPFRRRPRP